MRAFFQQTGRETIFAANEEAALATLRDHGEEIGAVIVDADGAGERVAATVQSLRGIVDPPPVFLAAAEDEALIREKYADSAPDAYLHKPLVAIDVMPKLLLHREAGTD